MTIDARTGSNFWDAGLSSGGANVLGVGGDFAFNNQYFVLDGTDRINETGSSAFGDQIESLSLRYDLVAGTASLILNPDGANEVLRFSIPLAVTATNLQNADGLFIRADSAFAGPSSFSISVVPEPSTAGYAMVGVLALLVLRRGRRV